MTLELFPYQVEGARFLGGKDRAGLFDDMGVGKSAQAIRAMDGLKLMRGIIVCPAAVREVWAGEIKKFARIPRRVLKGKTIQDLNLWLRGRADILLLSYEMATEWTRRIEGDIFDFIIFDEAHYLKNAESKRTRALLGHDCDGKYGLARWAAYAWFLTGTPNPNDAADIWSIMRFCKATNLTRKTFRDRYYRKRVGTYSTSHTPRDEMIPELKQAIRSFSLRRTKEQAGLQLPPIWLTTQTVDGDTAEIRALLAGYPGLEASIMEAVELGGLSFLDAQHIATLRRLVGEAKAPAFVELLAEELESGLEKAVVFGLHKKALELVRTGLGRRGHKSVLIDGSVGEQDRIQAVEQFRTDPDCRVFVGNIKAAGTGLTLTIASDIIMLESSWAPADNAQALMRVHRIGQERAVNARFISLANSIDERVSETVARKTASIAKIGA